MTLLPAIRDTTTFAKLYPVRFPIAQNAGYYLYRLGRAITKPLPLAYPWLPQALRDFAELERTHAGGSPLSSELHRQRGRMVAELAALATMPSIDPAPGFSQKDTIASAAGRLLGRIDLVSANYAAVRKYNPDLPPWEDLCAELDIPVALARSKSFRQSTLGMGNPKWQQRVQARAILGVIESIVAELPRFRDRIVRCSPDEIVFTVDVPSEQRLFERVAAAADMPARFELFILRKLSFAKAFTWTNIDPRSGEPVSVQPFMLPGNRFYIWLTRVVFGTAVTDVRDITYLDDGEQVRWAYDFNRGDAHKD